MYKYPPLHSGSPYKPTTVLVHVVEATDVSPTVPEHTTVKTPTNMSPENKAHFLAEKEPIHLIMTGIGDDIYSTVDACQTAQEMWEAIERSSAPSSKPSIPSRSHTTTRHKGKEIAKPITPPSETTFEEDSDPEQAQRDKDMQKNLALIAKYFKKIYKPTNNNLRTSFNSKNKNVDTTPRYKNDDHSGKFGNQRTVNAVAARENECRKPKRVKDSAYHKEKMLLCKQAEQGVSMQAEQYDWLANTDEEVDKQELEAHYSYMAKIQEVPTADSGTDSELVEQVQNKAGYNVFANHLQHSKQSESVSNTCLVEMNDSNVIPDSPDMCEDDIQNEQNDVESDDDKSIGESISVRDSCLVALQTKQAEFEKFKAFNDRTIDYDKLKRKLNDALGQLAHKDTVIKEGLVKKKTKVITDLKLMEEHDIEKMLSMEKKLKFLNEIVYKRSQSIQTIHMMAPKGKAKSVDTKFNRPSIVRQPNAQQIPKPSVLGKPTPFSNSLDRIYFQKTKLVSKANVSEGLSKPVTAQTLTETAKKAFAPILGYEDFVQGNVTINRVYYVEGLNHNLFSVGQFCDADLKVAFRKSTCFVRDLQGNELLVLNRGSDLYRISLQELTSSTPLCLMAKATPTQAWLWHRRLYHLNFDYINLLSKKDIVIGLPKLKYVKDQLCLSCELSKAKRSSFKSKVVPSSKGRLNLLHMDLCGPMRVASINGKKYIMVIVDDYSRYTWTLFIHSKDETPEVLKDSLMMIQQILQALVITIHTDIGTEFLNKTLNAFFKEEGIEHQTSTARTPKQNDVVKRQIRTLVEAARTMPSALQLPLFFWAEAIATACLIRPFPSV
nr:retrovirus-related Pol polyprotein from transposon TNT 1-94 [Tanacetum cinerariifolium]